MFSGNITVCNSYDPGTGKLSGATGSGSTTFHGAILQNDSQGHGMSWNAGFQHRSDHDSLTGTAAAVLSATSR
jgi:hypothetical protein